jgi:hypothetical protein
MGISINGAEVMTDSKFLTVRNMSIDSNGYIGAETSTPPTTSPLLGTSFAYVTGGILPPATLYNIIERFPVVTDSNGVDVGDLFITTRGHSGHSSQDSAFTSAGQVGFAAGITTMASLIQKFPFASTSRATFVGNLLNGRYRQQGASSPTHGYTALGLPNSVFGAPVGGSQPGFLSIEKFSFFSDVTTNLVGSATAGFGRSACAAHSSSINGYISGGHTEALGPTTVFSKIEKYPFSIDVDSAGVADLTQAKSFVQGHSSATHGYTTGGLVVPAPRFDTIDKFPFASDANATDIGDLIFGMGSHTGASSLNNGYCISGVAPTQTPTIVNNIQKFPFATDSNATDIADCVAGRAQAADHSD